MVLSLSLEEPRPQIQEHGRACHELHGGEGDVKEVRAELGHAWLRLIIRMPCFHRGEHLVLSQPSEAC